MAMAPTADEVQPLERHAEWRSADVADPEVWTHRLTADEITELEAALAHARGHVDDVLDVTKALFPLDTLVPVLDGIAEHLINGRGFQRISGLPVDRLGVDDASWIYWGVGMHLGGGVGTLEVGSFRRPGSGERSADHVGVHDDVSCMSVSVVSPLTGQSGEAAFEVVDPLFTL